LQQLVQYQKYHYHTFMKRPAVNYVSSG